jgi:hypothetical protein
MAGPGTQSQAARAETVEQELAGVPSQAYQADPL